MTSADVITVVCFCHALMGQGFFLLHVLLIQLCLLLIFKWHTWTLTWRHRQVCSNTMWPSYTTEPSLHISGTNTALLHSRELVAVWVYGVYLSAGTRCASSNWSRPLSILQPGGEDSDHSGINLPSRRLESLLPHLFPAVQTLKNWRRQQCFSASLGWPLDISDTSRCVRCFNVIFVFG